MYIAMIPSRGSLPAVLLRESYREGKRVRKRTLANLSRLPPPAIEALRRALAGEAPGPGDERFEIERSLQHGTVAVAVGTIKRLKLDHLIASRRSPERDRVVAMVAAQVMAPTSRLALARMLDPETATTSLGEVLRVEGTRPEQLYGALDWLGQRKERIQTKLAARHLGEGTLLLYEVTVAYSEGRTWPLASLEHQRKDPEGKLQIVVGLLRGADGCPVGVEVFPGDPADPPTLASQILRVRERWGVRRVVWVGDRGLLTEARIQEELRPVEGLEWIAPLGTPAMAALVESGRLTLPLFGERDLFEFSSPDHPGERLVACRNRLAAEERARKREALLGAAERELERLAEATRRAKRRLAGRDRIALQVGRVLGRYMAGGHFHLEIADDGFSYRRDEESIRTEARLDGVSVIRTSVGVAGLDAGAVVRSYRELPHVERAFRTQKTVPLAVRPIHHRLPERVEAHVLLCMLSYYVVWHMRRALAPLLLQEDDPEGAAAGPPPAMAPAQPSPSAPERAATRRPSLSLPVHSFETLLGDLQTLTRNRMRFGSATFHLLASPTPLQRRAFDLLGVSWQSGAQ